MTTTTPPEMLLTEEEVDAIAKPFLRHLGGDHWYSGEEGIADHEGYAKAVQRALLARLSEQQQPVQLDHIACIEDGKLRYMSGRCAPAHDCELYAMPNGGRAPALYAAPVPTPAAPVGGQDRDSLYSLLEDVLLNHRLTSMVCDDDPDMHFPLVDRLCPDGATSVEAGRHEIRLICDDFYNRLPVARPAAQAAQAVPAGWALVPVEPTDAMLDATTTCHKGRLYPQDNVHGPRAMRRREYAAMLAAAPAHAGERSEGGAR